MNSYNLKPFNIANITIDPPLVLAPMAGLSHSPFRQLVASFAKPGLFFSEMLSARHLPQDIKKDSLWLKKSSLESPLAYQIVAPTAEEAVIGAQHLTSYSAEIIDLNLACPAPSISRKRKSGAYLLSDLSLVEEMLSAIRAATPGPFTVKIRLGKKPDLIFLRDIAAAFSHCGVDAVTLHPRLTTEKLKRRARWEYIGHLKTMVTMPVIGNGDVQNREDCLKMFAQTGCDGVMIGRAAVQKPWIFSEITERPPILTTDFLETVYDDACCRILQFFPKEKAIGRIKEFSWYFAKNLKFGHHFAARLQTQDNLDQCLVFIKENFRKAAG